MILDVDKSILLDVTLPPLEELLPVATDGNAVRLESRMPRVIGWEMNERCVLLCP